MQTFLNSQDFEKLNKNPTNKFQSDMVSIIAHFQDLSILSIFRRYGCGCVAIRHNTITFNMDFFLTNLLPLPFFETLNYMICEIDKGNCVAGLYFDFIKAFDLVNHQLEFYGVRVIGDKKFALHQQQGQTRRTFFRSECSKYRFFTRIRPGTTFVLNVCE